MSGGRRRQLGGISPQGQAPPGVQFLGGRSQLQQTGTGGIVYIDNNSNNINNKNNQIPGQLGIASPTIRTLTDAINRNNAIPNSNLRISGVNHKGELIITGPGGSITIGMELLNGISRQSSLPLFTEFEEMELEGQNITLPGMPNFNPNRVALSQQGKGTIIIERAPQPSNVSPVVDTQHSGSAEALPAASSSASSSASAGGVSASSAASSSAGGAASSASSSAGSASSSSSSAASLGNGISLEQGGQIIRLTQNSGKTQTITLGGSNGQIQLADGGSGIQVPGNATFIVGG